MTRKIAAIRAAVMAAALTIILSMAGVGAAAQAPVMSSATFKARSQAIIEKSRAAQAACESQKANARDVCLARARGDEAVALAELKALYSPVDSTRSDVERARAQAEYRVDREKCDDLAGSARDECIAKARAAESAAQRAMRTTVRNEPSSRKASAPSTDQAARAEAAYEATKARCETYAPEARDRCLRYAR